LGVETIWAKAITRVHGEILTRIGAANVIFPEQEAGERTAHLLAGTMRNFTEFSPGYALANISTPQALDGKSLRALRSKDRYGVTIVALEHDDEFQSVDQDTELREGQNMIVAGPTERGDNFAKRISRPPACTALCPELTRACDIGCERVHYHLVESGATHGLECCLSDPARRGDGVL